MRGLAAIASMPVRLNYKIMKATQLFQGMSDNKKRSILNLVINTPRPKSFNVLPALFDHVVKIHL